MRIREELRPEQERDQALLQSLVAKMEVRAATVLSLSCTITFYHNWIAAHFFSRMLKISGYGLTLLQV